ncbi:MAG TPA: polysaccharide biosynthesis/export family protein, partial [Blastocatellia bacterium]
MRAILVIGFIALLVLIGMPGAGMAITAKNKGQQMGQDRGSSQSSQGTGMGMQPTAPATTSVVVSPEESYRIGPSDVIEVQVVKMPEISSTYRVDSDGTIMLPYIGAVLAEGTTARQLAKMIADGLRGDYLVNPQVAVSVLQINSKTYFIQGAVQRPGAYQIEGR